MIGNDTGTMPTAEQLLAHYDMDPHAENGLYIERHYPAAGPARAASGCIYYYVRPGERTQFHVIDCDEYWSFNAGSPLELWVIGLDGKLTVKTCGITPGAEPTVRFAAGEIFASRLSPAAPDGTFVTCLTVPRFTWDGFRMIDRDEIVRRFPAAAGFWEG